LTVLSLKQKTKYLLLMRWVEGIVK
jgi:hypothetical protein